MVSTKIIKEAGKKGKSKWGMPGMVLAALAALVLQIFIEKKVNDYFGKDSQNE